MPSRFRRPRLLGGSSQTDGRSTIAVRLHDGRLAQLRGYDPAQCRRVDQFMEALGLRTASPLAPSIHAALLAAACVVTIDGADVVWPAPTFTAVQAFLAQFAAADLDHFSAHLRATTPAGARLTSR